MNSLIVFKNNLRIDDNPVIFYGSKNSKIITTYIYDNINVYRELGSASKYWLHNSLKNLNESLNNNLLFLMGDTSKKIIELINTYNINNIFCEKPFLEDDINIIKKLKIDLLFFKDIKINFFNTSLLWDPRYISKKDKTYYTVFTPFFKKGCLESTIPDIPVGSPSKLDFAPVNNNTSIDDLNLLDKYNWTHKFDKLWTISEKHALKQLNTFIENFLYNYKDGRNFPASNFNSKLSPYIKFGLISVNRIWHELNKLVPDKNVNHFKSELGWREFSYYLLYYFPEMKNNNFQKKFDNLTWENCDHKFELWKHGKTGYPIIDAAMKELWDTGYMHNRTRMIVASFLIKNLLIDWRFGEKWFWDCLLDADHASNIASWQWVAGTGTDAATYVRIFNPTLQGEKFDQNGEYTLKYIPKLKNVPLPFLHKPWEFDKKLNYPDPIIDYTTSKDRAIVKFLIIN